MVTRQWACIMLLRLASAVRTLAFGERWLDTRCPSFAATHFARLTCSARRAEAEKESEAPRGTPKRSSTFRGVRALASGSFQAVITSRGERRLLGTFQTETLAALAYDEAARELHGASAKLNYASSATEASSGLNGAHLAVESGEKGSFSDDTGRGTRLKLKRGITTSAGPHQSPTSSSEPENVAKGAASSAFLGDIDFSDLAYSSIDGEMEQAGYDDLNAHIDRVVGCKGGLDPYWGPVLRRVDRPAARDLIPQLVSTNPFGFDGGPRPTQRETMFSEMVLQKKRYPKQVLLIRVGEFYETFGSDAVMLVQHAGLNPMGGRARAGCPISNVQQTLDGLTVAGLSVAVFEEVADVDGARKGPAAVRQRKKRVMTQVVSPASPIYLYDLCLRAEDVSFRPSRPLYGLRRSATGHTLVEVSGDEMSVRVSERLTDQAVRAAMTAAAAAEPVFVQMLTPSVRALLPQAVVELRGLSGDLFAREVVRRACEELGLPAEEAENFRWLNPEAAAAAATRHSGPNGSDGAITTETTSSPKPSVFSWWQRPRPLYTSTAAQIGLLDNANVPSLVKSLLPPNSPAGAERFLWKWLLTPPPHAVADQMRALLSALPRLSVGLPVSRAVPVGKAVALLHAGQANVPLFRELDECVRAMLVVLNNGVTLKHHGSYASLVKPLLALVSYSSGIEASAERLRERAEAVARNVAAVIARRDAIDPPSADLSGGLIGPEYFERNEATFRGCVAADHPTVASARAAVESAALTLSETVASEFAGVDPRDVMHDQMANVIALRRPPSDESGLKSKFVHPRGKDGKELVKRYTTENVEKAAAAYLKAVDGAVEATRAALQALSASLLEDLPTIVQASHWAAVLNAAELHARHSRAHGWCLPELLRPDDPNTTLKVEKLLPYWLACSGYGTNSVAGGGVANSFDLDGIFLLTAPNMSGKSTLMRATMAAALLATAGLCVPAASMVSPRFDAFFLRTASYDVPAERMSAFALEMDDVRVMLRDCTRRSLAMVDEIGKGTSARDGAAIAGALLEELDRRGVSGIFATHLHELFNLPLQTIAVRHKRMGIMWPDGEAQNDAATIGDLKTVSAARDGSVFLQSSKASNDLLHGDVLHADVSSSNSRSSSNGVQTVLDENIDGAASTGFGGSDGEAEHAAKQQRLLQQRLQPRWTYELEDGRCTSSLALLTASEYGLPEAVLRRAAALGSSFDQLCRPGSPSNSRSVERSAAFKGLADVVPMDSKDDLGLVDERRDGKISQIDSAVSKGSISTGGGGSSGGGGGAAEYTFGRPRRELGAAAEHLSTAVGASIHEVSVIAPGFGTPPWLEGRACVYILAWVLAPPAPTESTSASHKRTEGSEGFERTACHTIKSASSALPAAAAQLVAGLADVKGMSASLFYVGETDVIRQRLVQHRSRFEKRNDVESSSQSTKTPSLSSSIKGGKLSSSRSSSSRGYTEGALWALVLPTEGKSEARAAEAQAIATLRAAGFPLLSDRDGGNRHFAVRQSDDLGRVSSQSSFLPGRQT